MTQVPEVAGILHQNRHREAFAEVFGGDYMNRFTDPVVFREVTFYSPPVSQEYRQNFKVLSRNLFAETVYRRRKGFSEEILNHYVSVSGAKLDAIQRLITNNRDRLRELALGNGIEIDAGYLHCKQQLVPVIHSHIMQFLRILQLFDELLQITGSCTLHGMLSPEDRKKVEVQCRAAIRSFSGTIRNESTKMRKEAQRIAAEIGGDTELADTIQAQAEAEAHADAQLEADRTGLTVPEGADPVAMVANAKAAANAAKSTVSAVG